MNDEDPPLGPGLVPMRLLGALLHIGVDRHISCEKFVELCDPGLFANPQLWAIAGAMTALATEGSPVTIATVAEPAARGGLPGVPVVTEEYLRDLVNVAAVGNFTDLEHLEYLAKNLEDDRRRRETGE